MLKIFGRANSINVRKILWLIDELGLEYEREDWGRGFKDLQVPEFLALNPFGIIPVVVDEGHVLRDSHAILRYLAAKHKRDDLFPTDLFARNQVDQWLDWAGSDTVAPLRGAFMGGFIDQAPFNAPAFVEKGRADLTKLMTTVDGILQDGGPYITGGAFTIADIPLGLVINRYLALIPDGPNLTALAAYFDKLSERPAFMTHGRNGTP